MNILICDDDPSYREAISASIQRWADIRNLQNSIVFFCFSSTEDLLASWKNGLSMDVLFLDIEIPGEMSGLELAKVIRQHDNQIAIIFVTNYSEYACDGYSVNAMRYLKKPVSDPQLFESLDIAYRQWDLSQESSIFMDFQRKKFMLSYPQITYLEARGHYLSIYHAACEPLQVRCRISDILKKLPSAYFAQCHRSFAVNLRYVRNVTKTLITIAGNQQLPIGPQYVQSVFQKINEHYQGIAL